VTDWKFNAWVAISNWADHVSARRMARCGTYLVRPFTPGVPLANGNTQLVLEGGSIAPTRRRVLLTTE